MLTQSLQMKATALVTESDQWSVYHRDVWPSSVQSVVETSGGLGEQGAG